MEASIQPANHKDLMRIKIFRFVTADARPISPDSQSGQHHNKEPEGESAYHHPKSGRELRYNGLLTLTTSSTR